MNNSEITVLENEKTKRIQAIQSYIIDVELGVKTKEEAYIEYIGANNRTQDGIRTLESKKIFTTLREKIIDDLNKRAEKKIAVARNKTLDLYNKTVDTVSKHIDTIDISNSKQVGEAIDKLQKVAKISNLTASQDDMPHQDYDSSGIIV